MKHIGLSMLGILLITALDVFAAVPAIPTPAQIQTPKQSQIPNENEVAGPLYIYVMRQWAQTTNFGKDAADLIVGKLKLNMQNDPKLKGVITNAFVADLQQFIYELFMSPQAMNQMALLYSQYFTIDEMQDLLAFYKTPLGQKLVKYDQELTLKTQEVGMNLLKRNEKEYMDLVAKYLGKIKPARLMIPTTTPTPGGRDDLPTVLPPGKVVQSPKAAQ